MDKIWAYIVKLSLNVCNNMTGRLIPQVDELAKSQNPTEEIKEKVSTVTKFIWFVAVFIIFGLIIFAIKQIINLIKSKR